MSGLDSPPVFFCTNAMKKKVIFRCAQKRVVYLLCLRLFPFVKFLLGEKIFMNCQ